VTKEQPRPAGASASSSPAIWFPAPVIFGHFLLAAAGLVVWIVYLIADKTPLAWAAFIVLLPVALLGFTMFARWIGVYRDGGGPAAAPAGYMAAGTTTATAALEVVRAERHLPVPVVVAYDLPAATTLVLVLLTAIGVGEADRRRPRTPLRSSRGLAAAPPGAGRAVAMNQVEYQASFWFPVTPRQIWAIIERFDLFESWWPGSPTSGRRWRAGDRQRAARHSYPAGAIPAAA
jgi:hypothetical protein